MTPEERDDLLRNAPPEEGLEAKYERLLHAFEEQGRTMKVVAATLRCEAHFLTPEQTRSIEWLADELDPPEPLAEADAAEKFSQDCAARKPPTT